MVGPQGPFQRIRPGVYLDQLGAVVFNAADVLAYLGMEDTPETREWIVSRLLEELKLTMPDAAVHYRPPGDPDWRRGQ